MKTSRKTMHLGASPQIFRNAVSLRKNLTKAEEILWEHLKDRKMEGVKFRRQHPMKGSVADFYAHEFKIIIELDGNYHEENSQVFADQNRDLDMASHRMYTLRFTNDDVFQSLDDVLALIKNKISIFRDLKKYNKLKR